MNAQDQLTLLGLLVALSAYLSAIRLIAIDKIRESKDADRRWKLKKNLGWLTLADAPLVLASAILGFHILRPYLFPNPQTPQPCSLTISFWLCAFAGFVMAALHAVAWIKTVFEIATKDNK